MKPKNLMKKIRRLEKRLREGPKKLVKLKRKLEAMTPTKKKPPAKTAEVKQPGVVKKAKKKLNLSPERRAQLAAAMKARWAAKRAAAEANVTSAATDQPSTQEGIP